MKRFTSSDARFLVLLLMFFVAVLFFGSPEGLFQYIR